MSRSLLALSFAAGAVAAAGVLWYFQRKKPSKGTDDESRFDLNAEDNRSDAALFDAPALSPREVKKVLHLKKKQEKAEEAAADFEIISPRLEAFLSGPGPSKGTPTTEKKKSVVSIPGSGAPAAATPKNAGPGAKRRAALAAKLNALSLDDEKDDDDDANLDDDGDDDFEIEGTAISQEEAQKILKQQKKKTAKEENASNFHIVSPRLEKFLVDDEKKK